MYTPLGDKILCISDRVLLALADELSPHKIESKVPLSRTASNPPF